ncbi:hypothetical protein E4U60_003670 [Claviceps pazoutovae]|uniref:SET domain-containing protein n=1 Tax=Claviceps pazoutovae TaxID=1649127 RepID=A0A9P7SFA9_9HYPO|nr:hypothetical protein E4U60_003670 [Claviceps pazoutovae]
MDSRFKRSGEQMLSTFFENECFRIQRSQTAGLGAVAIRNLKEGDVILRERPLFTANASNVFEAYEKLTGRDKDVAMSLHANALLKPGTPRIQAVWKTNCFAVTDTVAGLFPVASRFNHACHPSQNVHFSFDRNSGLLILSIRAKHVAEGEELKVSYGIDRTPEDLYHLYGFICQCGTCSGRHPTVFGLEW